MTERQHEEELLSEMLDIPKSTGDIHSRYQAEDRTAPEHQPILTRREEQELLRAANQVGTPTLAPEPLDFTDEDAPRSFASDVIAVARKHPILALAAGAGIAYLLVRRRR
jgi:hypothetical protein